MRLTHITIENFKGIRDRVEIPLRPITLLFGANSAGKSTMLQAMLYLRELLERQNADADVVGGGGDVINLGGFRQMVHGHDLARKLTVGATVALDDDGLPRSLEVKECNAATEELHRGVSSIRAVSVEIEVEWCPDYAIPVIAALRVKADDESILEIRQERLDRPKLWLNEAHPALEEVLAGALGEQFPHLQDVIQGPTMILDQTTVIPAWHDPLTGYFPGEESEPELAGLPALLPIISRLALGAGRAVLSQLQSIRYIGPMREFPARSATAQRTPDGGRWASGLAAWDWLAKDIDDEKHSDEVARLDQWLTSKDHLDLGYSVRIVASRELPEESELNLMLRALRRSSEPEELALRIKALVDSDLLAQPVLRRVVITTGIPRATGIPRTKRDTTTERDTTTKRDTTYQRYHTYPYGTIAVANVRTRRCRGR